MTEIPEHLLKRSRERRQALGLPVEGGGDEGSGGAGSAASSPAPSAPAVPATTRPAAPAAPAAPPPPKPVPPYVQAAQGRRRIPIWAMPVVALLPLWLFIYVKAMQPPTKTVAGPLASGATVYGKCASCHGSDGEGGVGYQLNNGEVLKSFPKIQDQLNFVYLGNKPFAGKPYGSGRHIGGQKGAPGAMPSWGSTVGGELSDLEILEVVCHERYTLSGGDQTSAEFLSWCSANGDNYQKVASGGFAAASVSTAPPG